MVFQLLCYMNIDIQMLSGENLEFIQIDPCTKEFCLSGYSGYSHPHMNEQENNLHFLNIS